MKIKKKKVNDFKSPTSFNIELSDTNYNGLQIRIGHTVHTVNAINYNIFASIIEELASIISKRIDRTIVLDEYTIGIMEYFAQYIVTCVDAWREAEVQRKRLFKAELEKKIHDLSILRASTHA
jgi:hypothetical protein